MRRSLLIGRRVAVVALLLLVAGCEDELSDPQVESCDLMLEVEIDDVPASLRYLVSADGSAVVGSVTYTTPAGEVTTTTLDHDAPNAIVFQQDVVFDAPVVAMLRAQGEVATGGQIGLAYTLSLADMIINSDPSAFVCGA